jgi:hypothetical protein
MMISTKTNRVWPEIEDYFDWIPVVRGRPMITFDIWREGDEHFVNLVSYWTGDVESSGYGGTFEEAAENAYLHWRIK